VNHKNKNYDNNKAIIEVDKNHDNSKKVDSYNRSDRSKYFVFTQLP